MVETPVDNGATFSFVRAARQQQGLVLAISSLLSNPIYTIGAGAVWQTLGAPGGMSDSNSGRPELIDLGGLT